MESDWHRDQMFLLIEVLRRQLAARRPDYYVGGNQAVYFSSLQAKNRDFRAPDVFAVLGVENREREGWVIWEEDGKVPDLVIELTSPSTEKADRGQKFRVYESLRISEYFIYDPSRRTLEGWRQGTGGFEPLAPDSQGRLMSKVLQGALGAWSGRFNAHDGHWIRLFERTGAVVATHVELASIEAQRAEAEAQRAEAEAQRAEAEAQRAEAEAQRAADLEARLAAYEARFGKLDEG